MPTIFGAEKNGNFFEIKVKRALEVNLAGQLDEIADVLRAEFKAERFVTICNDGQ